MNVDADELPEGWAWTTIAEVASPSKKKVQPDACPSARYLSLEHIESETGRNLDSGHATDVNSTKAVFHAGDVLYGKLRPYLNKVTIPDFDGICSTDILVFPKTDWLVNVYLRHFLSTRDVVQYANHHSSGVQLPRVSFAKLGELPFPLPPLAEQNRIVAKVETLLARVNAARQRLAKVPAILKRFRQSVLAAACSGQLTEDWRLTRNSGFNVADAITDLKRQHEVCGGRRTRSRKGANAARNEGSGAVGLDRDNMPDLPQEWTYARSEDIVEPGSVVTYGIVLPGPQLDEGVPYVRGLDIENGRVLVQQLWKTSPEIAEKHERSRLEPGDVLLCIIRHLKVAIVPQSLRGGNLTQGTVRLRPSQAIMGAYLALYLESPTAQDWMKSRYFGMDMPRINVEDARAIPVPIPPKVEQYEIVRRVEALLARADRIEKRLATATRRIETLTQAILAQAFRGELVPTEAELARQEGRDYEPAAVLLERIRAARSGTTIAHDGKAPGKRRQEKQQ